MNNQHPSLRNNAGAAPLSIGIIAFSRIADDPRVRRQGDAFHQAGWETVAIGLPRARSAPPAWTILEARAKPGEGSPVENADANPPVADTIAPTHWVLRAVKRRAGQVRYVLRMQVPRIFPGYAQNMYWTLDQHFAELYRLASSVRPDIWLANDWTSLPIAERLASEQGANLVYDTHELAADEYGHRPYWRLVHRPTVVAIERSCLARAALITCVSGGIADRLQALYGLAERPLVIQNTPVYQRFELRLVQDKIRILYHGLVAAGRGLEECIRSMALLRPEFHLTIRGPGSEQYLRALKDLTVKLGVAGRVSLVPPVPMIDLVREASMFDIGLFALPDHSLHNRFALPNKFFEYVMAGLALCVSDLPEMTPIVKKYNLGCVFQGVSPEAIAQTINALDRSAIEGYKRASLAAARELNWENESRTLTSRCAALVHASAHTASASGLDG
jgi:glycosyltransferase involved in cell wall biosynthesis